MLIITDKIGRLLIILLLLYFMVAYPDSRLFSIIIISIILLTVKYCRIFKEYIIIGIFPFYKKKIHYEDITKYKVTAGGPVGASSQFVIFTKNNKKHSFNYSKNMHYQYVKSLMKEKGIRIIE